MTRPVRNTRFVLLLVLCSPALPLHGSLGAQQPEDPPSAIEEVELELPPSELGVVTPGGAFVRSLAVPGWGHVATESYSRGGFYVAAQTGSLWMLWQAIARRGEARTFEDVERGVVEARLRRADPAAPDTAIQRQAAEDPAVTGWTTLVESRDQQVEDWAALSIFLVLLGATDAFVAAHLADYPEPLTFDVLPRPDGAVEVGVRVPLWGRLGRP